MLLSGTSRHAVLTRIINFRAEVKLRCRRLRCSSGELMKYRQPWRLSCTVAFGMNGPCDLLRSPCFTSPALAMATAISGRGDSAPSLEVIVMTTSLAPILSSRPRLSLPRPVRPSTSPASIMHRSVHHRIPVGFRLDSGWTAASSKQSLGATHALIFRCVSVVCLERNAYSAVKFCVMGRGARTVVSVQRVWMSKSEAAGLDVAEAVVVSIAT